MYNNTNPKLLSDPDIKLVLIAIKNMYFINSYSQFLQMPCLGQVPEFAVRCWPVDHTFGGTVLEHR